MSIDQLIYWMQTTSKIVRWLSLFCVLLPVVIVLMGAMVTSDSIEDKARIFCIKCTWIAVVLFFLTVVTMVFMPSSSSIALRIKQKVMVESIQLEPAVQQHIDSYIPQQK